MTQVFVSYPPFFLTCVLYSIVRVESTMRGMNYLPNNFQDLKIQRIDSDCGPSSII